MKILAIETATPIASVAVKIGDRLFERRLADPAARAEGVLDLLRALLADTGLDLGAIDVIAFGRGPGSFTGLRVAAAVAQGLAYARGLPVIPISSLAALAQQAQGTEILAAIDARRDEVYYGLFHRAEDGLVEPVGPEGLGPPASLERPQGACIGIGNGFDHYAAILRARCDIPYESHKVPGAQAIAVLAERAFRRGEQVIPSRALPVYLRDDVAKPGRAP
ncbi:MAG TPA: tRNA (adenosine(37)-N6)-threonylcarbamoyltransferase complex dimerization subunit type 1 TsaB [Acidiferrobacter sp.]|nr:tRNA (adenosine(37)-N6)-threonylcarbamoyltransferase complex dimerization subunit type 1 TsaB [Acidiferrobacter sp.]